jgi:23S rRNA pseudouridine955/2504/2580 synthase
LPDAPLEIRHEDRHLLVVIKPSGIATTNPVGKDSLTSRLERERGRRLHPTSRLDAEVTGLVTFAKTDHAIAALRDARTKGTYGRGYLALTSAAPNVHEGTWETKIAIDPRDPTLRIAGPGEREQDAKSSFVVREIASHRAALWLTPHTGRTHQLRVHCQHAGIPILGDVRYGGDKRAALADGRVITARRTMLHCAWLRLPIDQTIELSAAAPDDMRDVWARLGGTAEALRAAP